MPSVGIFTYSVKPRGSVVHAASLAEALIEQGADVTLYALSKSGDGFFRPLECPLVLFPAGPAPEAADSLIEQRIGELHAGLSGLGARHDVYHAEDCLTASALLTAKLPSLRPIVRTVHHVERFESPYLAGCQRRSIERSDALVSVSAFTAREVAEQFGRSSRIIHNGVDRRRFMLHAAAGPQAGGASAALGSLGLGDDELVVLSVGGVEQRKNTLCALEAVSDACRRNPRLVWLVAGGASIWDHSELERRFDRNVSDLPPEIQSRIRRLGPVDDRTLGLLYARADILLAPSLHEGWGLSVLEALAAETAVICSAREPFNEFLDETSAYLVDPESSHAIAGALDALGTDRALRARLAHAGERVARAFSWERAARLHLELYASLEHARRPSPSARTLPAP